MARLISAGDIRPPPPWCPPTVYPDDMVRPAKAVCGHTLVGPGVREGEVVYPAGQQVCYPHIQEEIGRSLRSRR